MIIQGDCLEVLKTLPDNSIDSIVTDPPYELGFMGKSWDSTGIANNPEMWKECLRVLKPGGHLLSAGIGRTHHRMMCAVEDAGFEIRDCVYHAFGSGFPKSTNITKQIQKKLSLKPDDICSCGQKQKQTELGSQSDYQDHLHSCDEQPLAVQDSDQDVFPLQDDAHEHNHDGRNEGVPFEKLDDSDHFQKDKHRLSSDDYSHEFQDQSKDYQVFDNALSDKPLSKLNEQLKAEHKTDSRKSCTQHLGDDLVSSSYNKKLSNIHTVYQNIPQCQECKKLVLPQGVGTALKPAVEIWVMARKPIEKGLTVAENCLKWGTGGINIDESRVETSDDLSLRYKSSFQEGNSQFVSETATGSGKRMELEIPDGSKLGRFPANLILSFAENEYIIKDEITNEQKQKALKWIYENA